jgi:hypothetical protein
VQLPTAGKLTKQRAAIRLLQGCSEDPVADPGSGPRQIRLAPRAAECDSPPHPFSSRSSFGPRPDTRRTRRSRQAPATTPARHAPWRRAHPGWPARAARPCSRTSHRALERFAEAFDATTYPLTWNFRSTTALVDLQHVIATSLDAGTVPAISKADADADATPAEVWKFSSLDREAVVIADWIARDIAASNRVPADDGPTDGNGGPWPVPYVPFVVDATTIRDPESPVLVTAVVRRHHADPRPGRRLGAARGMGTPEHPAVVQA